MKKRYRVGTDTGSAPERLFVATDLDNCRGASGYLQRAGSRYNAAPMNHHDAEITEVVVVLDGKGDDSIAQAMGKLKELGLQVYGTKAEEGVIEGSIDASRVHDLKSVPGVCYVRSVFSYTADYPPGDPRDKDGPEPQYEDDEE